jgi:hypothetical protein
MPGPPRIPDRNSPLFTREEILELEHPAWTVGRRGSGSYYDAIHFWRLGGDKLRATNPRLTPTDGWWHKSGCICRPCREARAAGGELVVD